MTTYFTPGSGFIYRKKVCPPNKRHSCHLPWNSPWRDYPLLLRDDHDLSPKYYFPNEGIDDTSGPVNSLLIHENAKLTARRTGYSSTPRIRCRFPSYSHGKRGSVSRTRLVANAISKSPFWSSLRPVVIIISLSCRQWVLRYMAYCPRDSLGN